MSDEWSMRCRFGSVCWGVGQGTWPVLLGCIHLLLVPPTSVPPPKPVSSYTCTEKSGRHNENASRCSINLLPGVISEKWAPSFSVILAFIQKNTETQTKYNIVAQPTAHYTMDIQNHLRGYIFKRYKYTTDNFATFIIKLVTMTPLVCYRVMRLGSAFGLAMVINANVICCRVWRTTRLDSKNNTICTL